MPPLRKHKTLTLHEKFKILERLENGEKASKLAEDYGLGTSTISDIKKNKEKITRFIKECESGPCTRKTLKQTKYPEMEQQLYAWFCEQRAKFIDVSYEALSEKAKELYVAIYGKHDFTARSGWIINFKKRHGVRITKSYSTKKGLIDSDSNETNDSNPRNFYTGEGMNDASLEIKLEDVPVKIENEDDEVDLNNYDVQTSWMGVRPERLQASLLQSDACEGEGVSDEDALKCFNLCLKWAEGNNLPQHDIDFLRRLKEMAFLMNQRKKYKQTKITDFFIKLS